MAYDYFSQDEEQAQGGAPVAGGNQLSQESQVVTGAGQKAGGPTSSGQFTNLQNYLNANAPLKFGEQVAGRVGGLVDEAESAQGAAKTGFQGKVDQNTVKENTDLTNRISSDPESLAADEAARADLFKQRDARYQGPRDLTDDAEDYQGAESATNKAFSTADQTKSEEGRKAYLADEFGTKAGRFDYSGGMRNLDNLLIQNDPSAQQAFQGVNQRANQARDQFGTLQSTLNDYAKQGAAQTQAARGNTRGALGIDDAGNYQAGKGALGAEEAKLDQGVAARQAALQQEQQLFGQANGQQNLNNISPEVLARMGVDRQAYQGTQPYTNTGPIKGMNADQGYLFGVDPGQFAHFTPQGDINRGTANTPQELARMNALAQLAGLDNTFVSNPQDAGKYAQGNLGTYDQASLQGNYNQRQAAFNDEMGQLYQRLQNVFKTNGQVDPTVYQGLVNDVRQKYGMPRLAANGSVEIPRVNTHPVVPV